MGGLQNISAPGPHIGLRRPWLAPKPGPGVWLLWMHFKFFTCGWILGWNQACSECLSFKWMGKHSSTLKIITNIYLSPRSYPFGCVGQGHVLQLCVQFQTTRTIGGCTERVQVSSKTCPPTINFVDHVYYVLGHTCFEQLLSIFTFNQHESAR